MKKTMSILFTANGLWNGRWAKSADDEFCVREMVCAMKDNLLTFPLEIDCILKTMC